MNYAPEQPKCSEHAWLTVSCVWRFRLVLAPTVMKPKAVSPRPSMQRKPAQSGGKLHVNGDSSPRPAAVVEASAKRPQLSKLLPSVTVSKSSQGSHTPAAAFSDVFLPTPAEWSEYIVSHPAEASNLPDILKQWFNHGYSMGLLAANAQLPVPNATDKCDKTTLSSIDGGVWAQTPSSSTSNGTGCAMAVMPPSGKAPIR